MLFPDPESALSNPNGLLALGGDLSPERLLSAYRNGIFPWFSDGEPIYWWSPDPRAVLPVEQFSANRSLRKSARRTPYTATLNHAFTEVIAACSAPRAKQAETWISDQMQTAYRRLHELGYAHSIEIWSQAGDLIGGLYGVSVGGIFAGESMFHRQTDASKLAFWALVRHLRHCGISLIDCQLQNPHLASLGVVEISRSAFLTQLRQLREQQLPSRCWAPQTLLKPQEW